MVRLSANIGFLWPDRPLLERIEAAGRAGFRGVEMHWPYDVPADALAAACRKAGIVVLGLNTAAGNVAAGEFGLGALPGREADFAAALDQALRYAVALGAPFIHAMAGIVDPGSRDAERTLVANLTTAADRAAGSGIGLLLEAINPRDKPEYFYSTVERVAEIIRRVDRPNVKLMFDAYHVGVAQGDILRRLEKLLPLVGHIQIAAVPSRAEPDEGEIAFDRVLEAIDSLGYTGWVGCEYKPRADTDLGLKWREAFGLAEG